MESKTERYVQTSMEGGMEFAERDTNVNDARLISNAHKTEEITPGDVLAITRWWLKLLSAHEVVVVPMGASGPSI